MNDPAFRWLVPGLACLATAAQASAPPVVMVADLAGRVVSAEGRPLALAEGVPARLSLTLAPGARLAVIDLRTGEDLTFSGPATLRFDNEGRPAGAAPTARRKVQALQQGLRLEPGAWAQASVVIRKEALPGAFFLKPPQALPFRPAEDGFSPWLHPRSSVILERTPTLRWRRPPASGPVHLKVEEVNGVPLVDADMSGEAWPVPAARPLRPGATYRWRLSWMTEAGFEAEVQGIFRIATEEESRRIEALRPRPEAPFADRLAFAAALESLGLHDEASPHWRQLLQERPDDPTLQRMAAGGRTEP